MSENPPDDSEERERIRNEITAVSNRDTVAIVLRETLGAIPVIGPGLTELVNVAIPNSAFNRLVEFTLDLRSDLARLRDSLNRDYLRTDAAAFMVREIITQVGLNYQRENLEALRGAFVNSVITSSRDNERKELYLKILEGMTTLHLRLLYLCSNPADFLGRRGTTAPQTRGGALMQTILTCLPEMDRSQVTAVWNDLNNSGLVNGDANSLMGMASDNSLTQLTMHLTDFGRDYVSFITVP
jgi:hypothetical protein